MDKLEIALPWIITIPVSLLPWLFQDIALPYRFFLCFLVLLLSLIYVCLIRQIPQANGNKKLVIIVVLILVFAVGICVVFLSGKSNYDITHKSLGHSISIGMEKTTVDKILGSGYLSGTYYLYFGSRYYDDIVISYVDGKVESISFSTRQWRTEKGIYVGDGLYDVFGAYGPTDITPNEESQNNSYIVSYYLDGRGQVCSVAKAKKTLSFYIDENMVKITHITISNISKR